MKIEKYLFIIIICLTMASKTLCDCGDKASLFCPECKKFYCDDCSGLIHKKIKKFKNEDHHPSAKLPLRTKYFCPRHPDHQIETFCKTNKRFCCYKCFSKGECCFGHDEVSLQEVDDILKKDFASKVKDLEDISKFLGVAVNAGKKEAELREMSKAEVCATIRGDSVKKIKGVFDTLREAIDAREAELLRQLEEATNFSGLEEGISVLSECHEKSLKSIGKMKGHKWCPDLLDRTDETKMVRSAEEETISMCEKYNEHRGALSEKVLIKFDDGGLTDKVTEIIKNFGKVDVKVSRQTDGRVSNVSNTSATVSWDELELEGADDLKYECTLKGGKAETKYSVSKTSLDIKDLLPNTEYEVAIDVPFGAGRIRHTKASFKTSLLFTWKSGPNYTLSEGSMIATKGSSGCWDCTVVGSVPLPPNQVSEWKVKLRSDICKNGNSWDVLIGVGLNAINQSTTNNYNSCWSFICGRSRLSIMSGSETRYRDGQLKNGDVVGVRMDTSKGELSFSVNGTDYGVACRDIPTNEELVPVVMMYSPGNSVELIELT